eukprot:CAMPEP_0185904408 /NCGR_PEP_ID=MMETSP0196C-20130402/3716_1 /TAXON_ID=2932 /ORGANISM="Alexandrium fundyense, Strain CCMP1719" /LENGTH=53 /DNA_ID=CAMNT_0028623711 /DNA_START=104 /DNA_END=261 /DNA_ORIENTATION=-
MRWQQCGVDGKVGGASGVRLHVHAPLLLVKSESFQGALLAKILDPVNHLIASV